MKFIDTYNIAIGATVAILSTLFGAYWYVFMGFLVLNVMDWITGWIKARKLCQESSKAGLEGIVKKLGYWIIISVAFLMSYILRGISEDILNVELTFLNLIGYFTLTCLLVNEARSVLENLVEAGYKVPCVLIKGLAVTDKLLRNESEGEQNNEQKNHSPGRRSRRS